jgi:hypothetical protein
VGLFDFTESQVVVDGAFFVFPFFKGFARLAHYNINYDLTVIINNFLASMDA